MIIKNAKVFTDDFSFKHIDVEIKDDKFTNIGESIEKEDEIFDANGLYMIPGLVDIHFHGCDGVDFCDGNHNAFNKIAYYEAKNGVTTLCPATMTYPIEKLSEIASAFSTHEYNGGSKIIGINMEGPFISEAKKGAQNAKFIHKPDVKFYRALQDLADNKIKIVCIAPEEEGAMDFIDKTHKETVISIAHTTADYDTAMEAIKHGASHVTHLYNAMPPFSHRAPGVVGAASETGINVELICDGIHIHPSMVKATFKLFSEDNIIFISDSMMATGLQSGQYTLGGQDVTVINNKATLADGTIAGSATNLKDCMKYAITHMGIPMEKAIKCASANPAKAIGIYDVCGSISKGKYADFILMNKNLDIIKVFINGKEFIDKKSDYNIKWPV